MTRAEQKLQTFATFALRLAELSTCKRRQVGCVIAPPDFTEVYSIGYNGPARGIPNESCDATIVGDCGCVHSECNALGKLYRREPAILIASCAPCLWCARMILNSPSIERVYYVENYRNTSGIDLLRDRLPVQKIEL